LAELTDKRMFIAVSNLGTPDAHSHHITSAKRNLLDQGIVRYLSIVFSSCEVVMSKTWNQTRVASALRIEYPIIQGPLGGFSSQRLTAAVSNFGGLGSFGALSLEPNAIKDVIAEIRSLTGKHLP
jgi:hypothetical protein